MNFCPLALLPSPYLTGVVSSSCSQSQGPLGRALVGWHVYFGPQPSGSLAHNSAFPRSLRSGRVGGLNHSFWGQKEDSDFTIWGLDQGFHRDSKKPGRQCPHGQSFSIHPTHVFWRHQSTVQGTDAVG